MTVGAWVCPLPVPGRWRVLPVARTNQGGRQPQRLWPAASGPHPISSASTSAWFAIVTAARLSAARDSAICGSSDMLFQSGNMAHPFRLAASMPPDA